MLMWLDKEGVIYYVRGMEEIFRKSDFIYDPPSGAWGLGFDVMTCPSDYYDPPFIC